MNEHQRHIEEGLLSFTCPECEPIIMYQLRKTRKVHVVGYKK